MKQTILQHSPQKAVLLAGRGLNVGYLTLEGANHGRPFRIRKGQPADMGFRSVLLLTSDAWNWKDLKQKEAPVQLNPCNLVQDG